jgi:PAS domain S-box-containing protein
MELEVLGVTIALGLVFAVTLLGGRRAALSARATAEALRKQVKFSADVFDSLPVGLAMRDLQGRYVFVNRAWERFVGARREDVIGKTVHDRAPKADADAVVAEDQAALALGPGRSTELKDLVLGERHFMLTRTVIADAEGAPLGVLVASVETTERAAIEQALRNQVKFTNDLMDSLPVALAMRDAEGRYLFVNGTWEKIFEGRRETAVGQSLYERLTREEAEAVLGHDRQAFERGPGAIVTRDFEFRGKHLMQTRALMTDEQGGALGVLVASFDTTERHAMQKALAAEQLRSTLVVRAANVGILDWDGTTRTVYYSPRFKEILGHPADADTSDWPDYFDLVHPEDRERVHARFRRHIVEAAEDLHETIEYRLRRADGSYVWIEAVGASVRDEKGFATRFIASIEDISERRFQEEQLRSAVRLREEVERMSRHDLKTPLNSVIAMTRLLREGGRLPREDVELLAGIERAGHRILNMVNLSLDVFRMEQGSYEFRPRALDLSAVARRAAADLESQAASKGVAVEVHAPGPAAARAEEPLCYSMLANLLKNAIEAAPDGGTVTVTLREEAGSLLAEVHNAGAVPEAVRPRFFQKYATAGKSGGLGLGAYSARLMARVQQGDITMRTSETQGTTVTVRLAAAPRPAVVYDEDPAGRAAVVSIPGTASPRRVLVVDDDEFNRMVLRRSLPPPFRVEVAVNGRAALQAARRAWPDAVLLDLEMPVMDGYEAAAKLRQLEREEGRARCTIVAISSNDDAAIIDRALQAGCDYYLAKPAPREALLRILGAGETVDPDLRSSLPRFLESRRRLLAEMPATLAAGDRAAFRRLAHKLAGSFVLYGFAWAAEQCRALERDAGDSDPADLGRRAAEVRAHLDSVVLPD